MKIPGITCLLFMLIISGFKQAGKPNPTENRNEVNDVLHPARSAQVGGFIGEKLDLSYRNRILAQDVDRLVAPFRDRTETRCWQSEFWGKWFTSAVLAYRYRPTPQLKEKLEEAVDGLIATQTPDGYIGNYAEDKRLEAWDIWGRKYCMLGLLAWHDLTGSKRALKAARKEADYLINELATRNVMLVKKGNHRGMAASSVLEPVCLLYSCTGDKRYLDFAEEIVRQWEAADGPQLISKAGIDVSKRFPKPRKNWYGWEQGQKAYEMMSCYEGLLELYRLTGKEEYKQAVEKTWLNIRDTEINIAGSGSAMECWFGGKALQTLPMLHYQETCVTVTWIKLSQQLLRLTGETKYADAIEQAFYNALLGAMYPDGADWGKYSPLSGQRMEGSEQCGMGLNCCGASGPRGLFTFPLTALMGMDNGMQVNFYASGTYSLQTPGKQMAKLIQETDYPVTGKINIKIELPKSEEMAIRLRVPQWSKQTAVSVNGEILTSAAPGQYADIRRKWSTGDLISMELDMHDRIVKTGIQPEYMAIVHGPLVLARDFRFAGLSVDAFISPVTGKDGSLHLEPVAQKQHGVWMQFKAMFVPESYSEGGGQPVALDLCDYASAGNTYSEQSRFRTWFPQLVDPRKGESYVPLKTQAGD